jgi:ATP-binding cassette subfamily B protein
MEHRRQIIALARQKGEIKSLSSLLHYLKPYWLGLVGVALALLVTSSSVLSIGKGLGFLIDRGLGSGDTTQLNQALFILLGLAVALAIGTYVRFYLITYVGERVVADIRRDVYAHIISLSPEFFESTKTGEILSRLTADTELFQMVVGSSLSIALRNAVMFIGGIILLVITSPKLSGFVVFVITLLVFPIVMIGR